MLDLPPASDLRAMLNLLPASDLRAMRNLLPASDLRSMLDLPPASDLRAMLNLLPASDLWAMLNLLPASDLWAMLDLLPASDLRAMQDLLPASDLRAMLDLLPDGLKLLLATCPSPHLLYPTFPAYTLRGEAFAFPSCPVDKKWSGLDEEEEVTGLVVDEEGWVSGKLPAFDIPQVRSLLYSFPDITAFFGPALFAASQLPLGPSVRLVLLGLSLLAFGLSALEDRRFKELHFSFAALCRQRDGWAYLAALPALLPLGRLPSYAEAALGVGAALAAVVLSSTPPEAEVLLRQHRAQASVGGGQAPVGAKVWPPPVKVNVFDSFAVGLLGGAVLVIHQREPRNHRISLYLSSDGLETQELLLGFLRIGIRASLPFATMSGGMSVDFVLDTAAISFAVFFMTSPLSQTIDVFSTPAKVRYVNPVNLLCFYLNCMTQLAYGLFLPVPPVVPCNAYGVAVGLVSTSVCWWFARKEVHADHWNRRAAVGTFCVAMLSLIIFAFAAMVPGGAAAVGNLGMLVGIIMYGAPLSSLQEVLRTESSETLPVLQSFLGFLNLGFGEQLLPLGCWLTVGLRSGKLPVWGPNVIGMLLSLVQLALIYRYPAKPAAWAAA
eukprot:s6461_g2.t1